MSSPVTRLKPKWSFEDDVIATALSEDEFVERILAVVKRRYKEALDPDTLAELLDNIHESAHVSVEQRWTSREGAANDRADMENDRNREDGIA
jgi:hypothetical protein